MLIPRKIQPIIEKDLFKNKIIVIYGPRQIGKTTLLKMIDANHQDKKSLFLNCDFADVREKLFNISQVDLDNLFKNYELIFIDEAQRVKNVGITLKKAIDHFPNKQFIVTGSSSFDLSNEINEPLTGRKYEFHLYPFSLQEIWRNKTFLEQQELLKHHLTFGLYPDVVNHPEDAQKNLEAIVNGTLYKDVLEYQTIKHSEILQKLLQALSFQIGQEVSYGELATLLKVSKETIRRYIHLLEEAFIIFRLTPFSRNLRTELRKLRKIYFYDVGIRNALIGNFSSLELRNDIGNLWENFLMAERIKFLQNNDNFVYAYFWRTHQQQEIDYLEEVNGNLFAFEFKWNSKKVRKQAPKSFRDTYPNTTFENVTPDNYRGFLGLL